MSQIMTIVIIVKKIIKYISMRSSIFLITTSRDSGLCVLVFFGITQICVESSSFWTQFKVYY